MSHKVLAPLPVAARTEEPVAFSGLTVGYGAPITPLRPLNAVKR
jgi:hypothetical protein